METTNSRIKTYNSIVSRPAGIRKANVALPRFRVFDGGNELETAVLGAQCVHRLSAKLSCGADYLALNTCIS